MLGDVTVMTIDFSSISVLLVLFGLLTAVIKIWSNSLPGFTARKLFHAGGGLICCFGAIICPSYIEGCLAAFAATLAVLAMRLLAKRGISGFLYAGNDDKSLGDILFPASVLLLAWITKTDRLTFILPVLTMSLADCTAAFVGKAIGTKSLARTGEDKKTVQGSTAFFAVSFAVSALCGAVWSDAQVYKVIIISFIIALCCTGVEMFSSHGTDNVLIPITAYLLIKNLPSFGYATLILFAAVLTMLAIVSAIANSARVTTLFRAVRCSVMIFAALVLFTAQHPLAPYFIAVAASSVIFINSKAFSAPFGMAFTSLTLVSAITTAAAPVALLFLACNAACAAYAMRRTITRTINTHERNETNEASGNAVLARG